MSHCTCAVYEETTLLKGIKVYHKNEVKMIVTKSVTHNSLKNRIGMVPLNMG